MSNGPCCAHKRIFEHDNNVNGTVTRIWWECQDCNTEFIPRLVADLQAEGYRKALGDAATAQPKSLYDIPPGCICVGDGLMGMKCPAKEHATLKREAVPEAGEFSITPLRSHKWIGRQQGGSPSEIGTYEWVRYCDVCGMEDTCEDPLPPCPGSSGPPIHEPETFGDLYQQSPVVAEMIEPHEWDNKNYAEQFQWLIQNLSSAQETIRQRDERELTLRKELWLRHGCSGAALYGDDGEMQDKKCMIDFKRDTVDKIAHKLFMQDRERAKEHFATAPPALCPTCKGKKFIKKSKQHSHGLERYPVPCPTCTDPK